MSENDYVATAAAQKRLREVLTGYLGHIDDRIVETFADALLSVATIEYKSRAKQVVISLDLPDKAAISQMGAAADLDQAVTETAVPTPDELADNPRSVEYDPEAETTQAPPQPHIVPFRPVLDADAEYEDVHYD